MDDKHRQFWASTGSPQRASRPLSPASRCEASGTLPRDDGVGLRSLPPSVSRAQPGGDSGGGALYASHA